MTHLDSAARLLRDASDALTAGDHATATAKTALALDLLRAAAAPMWMDELMPDGRRVQITVDPYTQQDDTTITVDGEVAQITGYVDRIRDGGSTLIPTSAGVIIRKFSPWEGGWQSPLWE
jgi:hypothetical protein